MTEQISAYDRIPAHDKDFEESRNCGMYTEGGLPADTYDELVKEAERFLSGRELESTLRITELAGELRTALLVNNDPRVRGLLKRFEQTYQKEILEEPI